jgi:hypothetical protein
LSRIKLFVLTLIFTVLASTFLAVPETAFAKTKNKKVVSKGVLSDASFITTNALTPTEIQTILVKNGSFLKDFKENGRSAAQIIWDAAHGYGDATATMNGIKVGNTISPVAILANLQKEQSLISMKTKNDGSLNAAMGYGCPDSGGCDSKYKGFTKQVEYGSWQLRYNYERASGQGFKDFQVGKTVTIDGKSQKITSRWLSAMWRYTPHDGSNFANLFAEYGKSTTVTARAATPTVNSSCAAIKSKSLRRICVINAAKGVTATPASVTTSTTSTTSTTTTSSTLKYADVKNCDTLGSKAVQRACKIEKAKNK